VNYGLAPRPELPGEEMAALVAAAEELLRVQSEIVEDAVPTWRFSGRWFNSGPYAMRRPHPLN
jgi:hypothetical protein